VLRNDLTAGGTATLALATSATATLAGVEPLNLTPWL
jgi:hypothetical protein